MLIKNCYNFDRLKICSIGQKLTSLFKTAADKSTGLIVLTVEFTEPARKWAGNEVLHIIQFFTSGCREPHAMENNTRYCPISVLLAREGIGLTWILDRIAGFVRNPREQDWNLIETQLRERGCENISRAFLHASYLVYYTQLLLLPLFIFYYLFRKII